MRWTRAAHSRGRSQAMSEAHGGNIWGLSSKSGIRPGNIIDFSASISPFGLSPRTKAAIKKILSSRLINAYPDPEANLLKRELARFHKISPEEIIAANGSTELIYLIPRALRPKNALIVEPAFSEYEKALKLQGCKIDYFKAREKDSFRIDFPGLEKALSKKYSLIYIGNPSNPAGALARKQELLHLANKCERLGATVVVDEAFIDFAEEESLKVIAVKCKNLIVLRSMTKFFGMAGLRLGFAISNKRLINALRPHLPPWSVNTVASVAAMESLNDFEYYQRAGKKVLIEKKLLEEGFLALGFKVVPSAANYVMAKGPVSAAVMQKALLKKGILIRELSSFGLGKYYFRAAVRTGKENKLLMKAIREFISSKSSSLR